MSGSPRTPFGAWAAGRHVVLDEEDYVLARAGNQRADYRREVAQATRMPFPEAEEALASLARERGIAEVSPDVALGLIREIMLARYDAALRGSMS